MPSFDVVSKYEKPLQYKVLENPRSLLEVEANDGKTYLVELRLSIQELVQLELNTGTPPMPDGSQPAVGFQFQAAITSTVRPKP